MRIHTVDLLCMCLCAHAGLLRRVHEKNSARDKDGWHVDVAPRHRVRSSPKSCLENGAYSQFHGIPLACPPIVPQMADKPYDFDLGRFTVRNKWWKDLWELSCFDPTHGFSNFCLEGGQLWVGLETHQTIDISWDICCNHSRPGYNYTFIHLERLTLWLALARCHNNALPNGIGPLHGRIFIYIYIYTHITYILYIYINTNII